MDLKQSLLNLKKRIKNINVKDENSEEILRISNPKAVNKILEQATIDFFPKDGSWYINCFKRSNSLEMCNLPCHLRDDEWLANMLRNNQKLFYLNYDQILNFVKKSDFFHQKRHDYEQEIVKWQIDWMKNDEANWICNQGYETDLCFISPICDLCFRKGIVDTLSKIGLDIETIEEGIEKNSSMWRDYFMERAFCIEFEPLFYELHGCDLNMEKSLKNIKQLESIDYKHKENWMKIRKYEYYQNHKNSVDKYGIVEPEMMISSKEASELKVYLNNKSIERKHLIEEYKKELYKSKQKILKR